MEKRITYQVHEAVAAPLHRMLGVLKALDGKKPTSIRHNLFYSCLADSLKVALKLSDLMMPSEDERVLTTEPAETLVRFLFERSLVVRYLATLQGDEAVHRYNKTADESLAEKWPDTHTRKFEESEASQIPPYRQMADLVDPSGIAARLYKQLSHIAHPRTSIPYSVAESTMRKERNISPLEFFTLRRDQFVPIAADALTHICDVCERELSSMSS